ncbi:MAG: T9SS type A sorting domain-containing protein [Bacteroidota bacterium]
MRSLLLLSALTAALGVTTSAHAQCARGTAEAHLENAGGRALLSTDGSLIPRGVGQGLPYEIPRGSGAQVMDGLEVRLTAEVNGGLRASGNDFGLFDFVPGPLDGSGNATADLCATYDRIWRVTLEDIARYNTTGEATADLAEWPTEAGAPVVDGDGNPDNYDLAAGDRPAIIGDETAWWIVNDDSGQDVWQAGRLRVELRVLAFTVSDAYAVHRLGLSREDAEVLHYASSFRYAFTNRRTVPLEDARIGYFARFMLGNFRDDYMGSAPDQNLVYAYNADNVDDQYGVSPPALGLRLLTAPVGKPLACFMDSNRSSSAIGTPTTAQELAWAHQCRWRDGAPLTFGGGGYSSGEPTNYSLPAVPPDYWSDMNIDGFGSANLPSFSTGVLAHEPTQIAPGGTAAFSLAFIYSRSEGGHLASVRKLIAQDAPRVGAVLRDLGPDPDLATLRLGDLPAPLPPLPDPGPEPPSRYAVAETPAPNPTTGDATLRLDLPASAHVRLEVFDALGRRVATPVDETLGAAEHRLGVPTEGLPPGVYVYRLSVRPEGQSPITSAGRLTVVR